MSQAFRVRCDPVHGRVVSAQLHGEELLDATQPCAAELLVNDVPLTTRLLPAAADRGPLERLARLKGERWVDHLAGWGLVVARSMGGRDHLKHACFGIQYTIRREPVEQASLPCSGPGDPPVEAPLYVDTFSLLNWNWKFWGDDTRMIFPSAHSSGPHDEFGHVGYDHDTPENSKRFMQNIRRRIYPGTMVIHGGVFYNAKTGHWIAITCRRPQVGYVLNLEHAGRGIGYDFTLHAPFPPGEALTLPEIKIYYGQTRAEMWQFMADYVTHYYESTPDWVFRTLWSGGLAWDNRATWREQGEAFEQRMATGESTGISYCLVTNRPIQSGTTPTGYEPDPNYGTIAEFRDMCRRLADKGVPILIWMSHSGLMYRGGPDIDDDWFIRGVDGRISVAWGDADRPELAHVNPGHPGYIEYTKKWIRFYLQECGARGIFFDCLGWAFPPDFKPRSFMRYPGDTNRMTVRFLEEVFACIKACDPEGLCFGEGTTFEAPVNLVSLHHNPVRAIDGWGPRDFLLQLNRWSAKRMTLDQGPHFSAAAGFVRKLDRPGCAAKNRYMAALLRERGGPRTFTHLPGDLSVLEADRLLVVPALDGQADYPLFRLPEPWNDVSMLVEETDATRVKRAADGTFQHVPPGVYRMT